MFRDWSINADFNDMVKCKILRMRKTRKKDHERNRPQLAQRIVRRILLCTARGQGVKSIFLTLQIKVAKYLL